MFPRPDRGVGYLGVTFGIRQIDDDPDRLIVQHVLQRSVRRVTPACRESSKTSRITVKYARELNRIAVKRQRITIGVGNITAANNGNPQWLGHGYLRCK